MVLLVGSNPLPNYVVGKYLLDNTRRDKQYMPVPDTILLVHSQATKIFADKLKDKFKKTSPGLGISYIDLGDKESDPKTIRSKLEGFLSPLHNVESLHLNFTGGKKTMAVYSYVTVYDYIKKNKDINAIFSYLDPDRRRLVLQDGRCFPAGMRDLRDYVCLNINTVLELHDMEIVNPGSDAPAYKDARAIKQFGDFLNSKNDHKKGSVNNGDWGRRLEDFVLITLKNLRDNGDIEVNEIKRGVEADYAGRRTEIDLIVIKGYEMFLISCTTSQKIKSVKQKAFEALYRAEQLGGEHAKVIVISLMYNNRRGDPFSEENNLEQLKRDLSQFDAAKNAAENLIGIDELRKELGLTPVGLSLSERLKNIIEG